MVVGISGEVRLQEQPDDTDFLIRWREGSEERERILTLGELKRRMLRIVPGQKIAYITDVANTAANEHSIVELVRGADILFIEAAFAREDAVKAADRAHLTTEDAGRIARLAGVTRVEPFHFSPRYSGEPDRLRQEVEETFAAAPI